MRAAMLVLAGCCVVLGLAAGPVIARLGEVAATIPVGASAAPSPPLAVESMAGPALGSWDPALLAVALGLAVTAAWALVRARSATVRRTPTWTCGVEPEPAFEYTATAFSKPVRLFFEPIYRPEREIRAEFRPGTPFPSRIVYRSEIDHLVESRVYQPLHRRAVILAETSRRVQHGSLQVYLAYTVIAVVVLLLLAR
jgi:hypothetical protein